jgi:hypothetical protein
MRLFWAQILPQQQLSITLVPSSYMLTIISQLSRSRVGQMQSVVKVHKVTFVIHFCEIICSRKVLYKIPDTWNVPNIPKDFSPPAIADL